MMHYQIIGHCAAIPFKQCASLVQEAHSTWIFLFGLTGHAGFIFLNRLAADLGAFSHFSKLSSSSDASAARVSVARLS